MIRDGPRPERDEQGDLTPVEFVLGRTGATLMRPSTKLLSFAVCTAGAALVIAACGSNQSANSSKSAPIETTTTADPAPTTAAPGTAAAPPQQWTMPNLVGSNLQ